MKDPDKRIYRGAVIGTGRIGSKIDAEQKYYYFPYPWAHAPAMIESKRVRLVAGADLLPEQREDFRHLEVGSASARRHECFFPISACR